MRIMFLIEKEIRWGLNWYGVFFNGWELLVLLRWMGGIERYVDCVGSYMMNIRDGCGVIWLVRIIWWGMVFNGGIEVFA